ncbi:MAG: hypothetical protein LBR16_01110 [Treponema sp.]|jgi:hypothetical protein|nr:hypothetical protein [Treponema sp.]
MTAVTINLPDHLARYAAEQDETSPGWLETLVRSALEKGSRKAANRRRGPSPAPLTEAEMAAGVPCPLCEYYHTPNAETIAAFEETEAMLRGELPMQKFDSFDAFLADLRGN